MICINIENQKVTFNFLSYLELPLELFILIHQIHCIEFPRNKMLITMFSLLLSQISFCLWYLSLIESYDKEENDCKMWIQNIGNTVSGNRKQWNNTVANEKLFQWLFSYPPNKMHGGLLTNWITHYPNLLPLLPTQSMYRK